MTGLIIAEAFTAVGTIAMAVTTVVVIHQNKSHHQDSFRPICVLVPDEGQDAVARRDVITTHEEPNNPFKYYSVKGGIKNIGCGPALKLRITICSYQNPVCRPQAELEPLGSKQCIQSPIKLQAFLQNGFNLADYQAVPGTIWELWLVYEDVFGRVFHTRHSKTPQQPWTTLGKGEIKTPLPLKLF